MTTLLLEDRKRRCVKCGALTTGSRGRATGTLYSALCPPCMDAENAAADAALDAQVRTFNAVQHFLRG